MRQFDVVENPSERSRRFAPYFLVLQSHYLETLNSVIVAPIVRDATRAISVLDVAITFEDEALILTIGELFSTERELLKTVRGSLAGNEEQIRRALDRAFTGF